MEKITVDNLSDKIYKVKNEVDALQIAVLKQHTPWYKNVPTIISLLALVFSFGTTYVSYTRSKDQDIQNLRSELRVMLQRLALLPKENFELQKKYADDAGSIAFLSGYINQENTLLARQATEIAKKLPIDRITATEYYAIALALENSYDIEGAADFLQLAINKSDNMNNEISALRTYAGLLFTSGQPQAGRVEYQKALNIFSRYKGYNDYTQKSTNIWTELSWTISEANVGSIDEANQHVSEAEKIVSTLPTSPGMETLKKQIIQTKSMLNAGSNLIMPSGGLK